MKEKCPDAQAGEFASFAELALMRDSELNSYDLISTYIGSQLFDRLDSSWTKIIILRDPIARLKSSYCNLRASPKEISFASAIAKSQSFRAYLSSRDAAVIFQATNTQTWTLLGDKSLFFRQKHEGATPGEIIAMVEERLSKYNFVGFTEKLDDLWKDLCQHFGWDLTPLPRLRVNATQEIGEEAVPADLEYHTGLDCELVRIARTKLESRTAYPQ